MLPKLQLMPCWIKRKYWSQSTDMPSNVATGKGYSVAAYGSASTGLSQTSFAGNVSALSISYVNTGGSENYILRVTCTYSGVTAPSISVTANGQSTSELRAAT